MNSSGTKSSAQSEMRLQVIGGGRMGQALLQGMVDGGWATPSELAVVEVSSDLRDELAARYPATTVIEKPLDRVDALIAVKPQFVVDVCGGLAGAGRVLSVAAGVTIASMEAALGEATVVVRAMPNTPALVGVGAAALAGGTAADDQDIQWAAGILRSVGEVVVVAEPLLDAVTGLSGSGPAYVFLMAEAMTDAGVAMGLPRDVAALLSRQTILGAGKMMAETSEAPAELRAGVTTPAGTTAAGLGALEDHGFRAAVAAAVRSATARSAELGKAD